eukprot:TRINITY_DN3633_c0_g1_i1.p1 TRINITY_DN3633_c0_g1~~TRINITY_DN3633_c0_g1_i1.p1  ORF type:complete len:243 (+),score=66.73 TRINITY_DN3633_c0_g1_i1:126-854(+)
MNNMTELELLSKQQFLDLPLDLSPPPSLHSPSSPQKQKQQKYLEVLEWKAKNGDKEDVKIAVALEGIIICANVILSCDGATSQECEQPVQLQIQEQTQPQQPIQTQQQHQQQQHQQQIILVSPPQMTVESYHPSKDSHYHNLAKVVNDLWLSAFLLWFTDILSIIMSYHLIRRGCFDRITSKNIIMVSVGEIALWLAMPVALYYSPIWLYAVVLAPWLLFGLGFLGGSRVKMIYKALCVCQK